MEREWEGRRTFPRAAYRRWRNWEAFVLGVPLVDLGGYPEINCYGCGDWHIIGDRARFFCFDWFKVGNVWQPRVVGTVTRSMTTLREEQRAFWQQAKRTTGPVEAFVSLH